MLELTSELYRAHYHQDIRDQTENIQGLKYLSWAYAVLHVKQLDPKASWAFLDPINYPDGTMMVHLHLHCLNNVTYGFLPVMHRARIEGANGRSYVGLCAKPAPDAMDINKTMQRCLAKTIAIATGIGLSLYTGEDLDYEEKSVSIENLKDDLPLPTLEDHERAIGRFIRQEQLTSYYNSLSPLDQANKQIIELLSQRKAAILGPNQ
jgi:hypothetical protein